MSLLLLVASETRETFQLYCWIIWLSGLDRSDHDAITSVTNATTLNSNLPLAGYETLVDITEVEEVVEFSEKGRIK